MIHEGKEDKITHEFVTRKQNHSLSYRSSLKTEKTTRKRNKELMKLNMISLRQNKVTFFLLKIKTSGNSQIKALLFLVLHLNNKNT